MSGNLAVEIPSLKLCIINPEKISRFALIIFTGMSFCWITLDVSSESISLSTSSTSTAEKLKCPWCFSFIFIILGCFLNILIISVTDSLLTGYSNINLLLIPKFSTRYSKYDWDVSATFLSSGTTLLYPVRVSYSFIVANHGGQKRFYSYFLY